MAEEKDATSVPLSQGIREDEEGRDPEDPLKSPPTSPDSSTRRRCEYCWFGKAPFYSHCITAALDLFWLLLNSVVEQLSAGFADFKIKRLAVLFFKVGFPKVHDWMRSSISGCCYIFVTWWFIQFVDGFFSPLYAQLGIDIFGLGFVTSLLFVFLVGVFVSSWLGATVFWIGEWFIKRMPFVRHLYSASKQISSAISPDQNNTAFKEVAIIRHPRVGEYAFGFITSSVLLQRDDGDEELCSVFVPTNHLYIGDIFLVNSKDIIRPNLSIREGIEIIVSGGMTMPQRITPISPIERVARQGERIPLTRLV
ncbi:hypothetical protein DH2020_040525 [Rehmannia glutinosa]|uniref:Uncharacterized protein n=1 Tax=Rehmannia glutinosa TaxID=99300 RepID=A0ABR0UTZ3_REHGL